MRLKSFVIAGALLLGFGGFAVAAPAVVRTDLNMRSGPGTGYPVVNVIPGGAQVNVLDCGGSWCRVAWGDSVGYASRSYLGRGGYVRAPGVVIPAPVYRYGYPGYRYRYGYPYRYGYRYGYPYRYGYRYGWPARRYYWRHHR